MNSTKRLGVVTFLMICTICISCTPEEICRTKYLADLALEAFKSIYDRVENGQEIYSVTHTVVNFIGDVAGCSESVETAIPSKFMQRIIYSDNKNFSNPRIVDEKEFNLNSLPPGVSGQVIDRLGFAQDGFYLFHSIADYTDVVKERDEKNNEGDNFFEKSSSIVDWSKVVHVTKSSKDPVFDEDGNRIFINRLYSTVKYE